MLKKNLIALALVSLCFNSSLFAQSDRKVTLEPNDPAEGAGNMASSQEKNIFAGANATASGTFGNNSPNLALDSQIDPKKYWGCENLPAWHMIDMGKPKTLSSIRLWSFWADGRIYKYKIEGSKDGHSWETLVDQSSNSISGTPDGNLYSFDPANVRYVRTIFLDNSKGKQSGGHIVEIQGFEEQPQSNLNICAIPTTERLPKHQIPSSEQSARQSIDETAWKGERVNGQIALWSDQPISQLTLDIKDLKGPNGATIPMNAAFVRFTLGRGKLYADIIDEEMDRVDLPGGTTRSVWIWVDVPGSATPGIYKGEILAKAQGSDAVQIPVSIRVLPTRIAEPKNWKVHLDIWQHPHAVARVHNVAPWSPEHFALLKPIMKRLADAGQKTITCSLIDEAWNGQTYDLWPSMIEWKMNPKGVMTYDYTNFDKWVHFMLNDVGITGHITCYTMIPWSNKLRYLDQVTGTYKYVDIIPNHLGYEKVWGLFLKDFREHAKKKGWLDKICIGIDERPDSSVKAATDLIKKYAPEFKIGSAVNTPTKETSEIYDVSPIIGHSNTVIGKFAEKRKAKGQKTTFYVCCDPETPNTFTTSPLAESEWLAIFSAANNLDGFLRWAYNSWGRDPFLNTDFGNWNPGDAFLVYPGNKSSLRFEKLRDGLENFEKIEILRQAAKCAKASPALKKAIEEMNQQLQELFTVARSRGKEHRSDVEKANEAILKAALLIK